MMTNIELQALYTMFNKQWFGNRLPKDMVVRYDKSNRWQGNTKYYCERPLYILINERLRWSDSQTALTLLHEMVHVELPYRFNHGPQFHKRMMQLARKGAFRLWW